MTSASEETSAPTSAQSIADRRAADAQAAALRARGMSTEDIAQALGMSSPNHAAKAAGRGLKRALDGSVSDNRSLDATRIDLAIAAIWPRIEAGQSEAVSALASLIALRIELLGHGQSYGTTADSETEAPKRSRSRSRSSSSAEGDDQQLSLN